jgi:hypothetical protein
VRIRALETGRYRASQRAMPRQFTGLRHQANTQAWPRLVRPMPPEADETLIA